MITYTFKIFFLKFENIYDTYTYLFFEFWGKYMIKNTFRLRIIFLKFEENIYDYIYLSYDYIYFFFSLRKIYMVIFEFFWVKVTF